MTFPWHKLAHHIGDPSPKEFGPTKKMCLCLAQIGGPEVVFINVPRQSLTEDDAEFLCAQCRYVCDTRLGVCNEKHRVLSYIRDALRMFDPMYSMQESKAEVFARGRKRHLPTGEMSRMSRDQRIGAHTRGLGDVLKPRWTHVKFGPSGAHMAEIRTTNYHAGIAHAWKVEVL